MAGKKGQKKRFWSDDEKRSICRQTLAPGVSVAQVARRYSMNSNLIIKWLRDPRFAPNLDGAAEGADNVGQFLPVEISGPAVDHSRQMADLSAGAAGLLAQRVDITLSDGRRVLVEGPMALTAVVGLVQGLAT